MMVYKCSVCEKPFSRESDMRLHQEKVHLLNKQFFNCPHCSTSFLYKKNLSRHQRSKHPESRYEGSIQRVMDCHRDILACKSNDENTVDSNDAVCGSDIEEEESMEDDTDEMENVDEEEDEENEEDVDAQDGDEDEIDSKNVPDILNLSEHPNYDKTIESMTYHSHYPYANTKLEAGEEIRIPVQFQDMYTLPSESFIYMELCFLKEGGTTAPEKHKLINNPFPFLFDEIRYELCGTEIDKVRNPGIASTLKGLASFSPVSQSVTNMGWVIPFDYVQEEDKVSHFNVCIPLSTLLGFAEDYRKILINVKQELIFVRARNDANCYTQHVAYGADESPCEKVEVKLLSLCWKMPYVAVNETERLSLTNYIKDEKIISLHYRSWDMHEYPLLPTSNRQVWSIKTSTQLEKPRFVILAFQNGRNNVGTKPSSGFDHCDLTNVKLYLNSRVFPYDDLNLKFSQNKYSLLYHMYASFQTSYYGIYQSLPYVSCGDFKNRCPMIVIDCSKQSESIENGTVDVRIEFESEKKFPANTTAYCLILHERLVQYNPLTSVVHKMR